MGTDKVYTTLSLTKDLLHSLSQIDSLEGEIQDIHIHVTHHNFPHRREYMVHSHLLKILHHVVDALLGVFMEAMQDGVTSTVECVPHLLFLLELTSMKGSLLLPGVASRCSNHKIDLLCSHQTCVGHCPEDTHPLLSLLLLLLILEDPLSLPLAGLPVGRQVVPLVFFHNLLMIQLASLILPT
uniref:Uncharacterized protein n=1 Tax=Timema genevievae TaxID=629358 RepID=A0A7R9K6Y8_TIMGE|nr:unnamed protein product [Timema genevievae]